MATLNQAVDNLCVWFNNQATKINKLAQKYIRKGWSVDKSIRQAMADINLEMEAITKIKKASAALISTTAVGIEIDRTALARSWATKVIGGRNLSERIYNSINNYQGVVFEEIKRSMNKINAWRSIATEVRTNIDLSAELPAYMDKLITAARRANLSTTELAAYKSIVAKAQRKIDALASAGAPTERLKKAYQAVIVATEKGTDRAVSSAVKRAIIAKAQYNAERLVRTEMAAAYNESVKINMAEDPDCVAYKSELSPRHNVDDICDFYANADIYGMGPGVFPKDHGPAIPYHANCLCSAMLIYKDPKQTNKDPSAYINKASNKKLEGMFGKHGAAVVKQNPSAWREHIKNYQPFESKKPVTI